MLEEASDDLIRAVLAKHGLAHTFAIERVMLEGVANYARLTGDLCVKLLKNEDFLSDVYTEVVAGPAAFRAGVRTPELLVFDDERDLYPGTITVWRRYPGEALGNMKSVPDLRSIYLEIASEARKWHEQVTTIDDPNDWLDKPHPIDPWDSLTRCTDKMNPDEWCWAESLLRRLDESRTGEPAFVHWDLHAHNVLVKDGRLSAIVDWGDAGFGDPVINFTCFPAAYLPESVEAFGVPDPDFIGRLIREVFGYALNAYEVDDWETLRHTGMKRWRSIETLYERELSEEWRHWLGDPPPSADRST